MACPLPHESIFHLGIKLIDILQLIHHSGYVFNDLKPDNILIGFGQVLPHPRNVTYKNIFSQVNINLIDFGLVTRWSDPISGKHCKLEKLDYFEGNLFFSSVYQLLV